MYRWTARFALLVMLVPVIGPLALAISRPPEKMQCCIRRPLAAARVSAAEPEMPCHHRASDSGSNDASTRSPQVSSQFASHATSQPSTQSATSPSAASSEASFRSLDCCGQRCGCCQSSKTSEWARLASNRLFFISLHIEPAVGESASARVSAPLLDADSARAPPSR
jgi:hypothetical protein